MDAGQTHSSIPIYLQPFTSYSEILVGNCNFFLPLAFNAPIGVIPLDDLRDFGGCRLLYLYLLMLIVYIYVCILSICHSLVNKVVCVIRMQTNRP